MTDTPLEAVLKRDRTLVLAGILGLSGLCWIYLVRMAHTMGDMPMTVDNAVAMTQVQPWTASYWAMMCTMWIVMMIGMMTPTAAPMVLVFARFNRTRREQGQPFVPTGAFFAGYLVVWSVFSVGATVLQWALDRAALLSPAMVSTSPALGGGILIAAGIFQLTPAKNACLAHCRSPMEFFMRGWRDGTGGALRMGIEHGAYCMGCCWILMCLLFFGGVMNLLWIAAITLFVLLEKVAPHGPAIGRVTGAALIGGGLLVIAQS